MDHYTEKEISRMEYSREGTQQFGNTVDKVGHQLRTRQGGQAQK